MPDGGRGRAGPGGAPLLSARLPRADALPGARPRLERAARHWPKPARVCRATSRRRPRRPDARACCLLHFPTSAGWIIADKAKNATATTRINDDDLGWRSRKRQATVLAPYLSGRTNVAVAATLARPGTARLSDTQVDSSHVELTPRRNKFQNKRAQLRATVAQRLLTGAAKCNKYSLSMPRPLHWCARSSQTQPDQPCARHRLEIKHTKAGSSCRVI